MGHLGGLFGASGRPGRWPASGPGRSEARPPEAGGALLEAPTTTVHSPTIVVVVVVVVFDVVVILLLFLVGMRVRCDARFGERTMK